MTEHTELVRIMQARIDDRERIEQLEVAARALVRECETNDHFADNPHGTEADALEAMRALLEAK